MDSLDISIACIKRVYDENSTTEMSPIESHITFRFDHEIIDIKNTIEKYFKSSSTLQTVENMKNDLREFLKNECDENEFDFIWNQTFERLKQFPCSSKFEEKCPIDTLLNNFINEKYNDLSNCCNKWNIFFAFNNMSIEYLNKEFEIKSLGSSGKFVPVFFKLNELNRMKPFHSSVFHSFENEILHVKSLNETIEIDQLDDTLFTVKENDRIRVVYCPKNIISAVESCCSCFSEIGLPTVCFHCLFIYKTKQISTNIFPLIFIPEIQEITENENIFIPKLNKIKEINETEESLFPRKRKEEEPEVDFASISGGMYIKMKDVLSFIKKENHLYNEISEEIEEESEDRIFVDY